MFHTTDRHLLSSLYKKARFRVSWGKIFLRVTCVALLLLANTIVFLPFALLRRLPPIAWRSLFYRMYTRVLGISLRLHGAALGDKRVLYVSNHISYIDIAALLSITGARFVSRGDIASVPFFGWLMKLYGTVFIHRVRADVRGQIALLRNLLDEGKPLFLFGEGTTSDGRSILPIKSSLFAVFETIDTQSLALQPISIRYSLLDGIPMGTYWEPLCAWYGKMSFLPHLWEVLSLHRITIDVYVHPPTPVALLAPGRKSMAKFCEEEIRKGLALLRYRGQGEFGHQEDASPSFPKSNVRRRA